MLDNLFSHSIYDDQIQIEDCELLAFVRAVTGNLFPSWMVASLPGRIPRHQPPQPNLSSS